MLITQLERDYIHSKVHSMKFHKDINPSIIISSILRAALDCRAYGLIKHDLIDTILTHIKAKEDELHSLDYYHLASIAVSTAAKYFIEKKLCKDKNMKAEYVENRYSEFLMEGSEAWNTKLPLDFLSTTKNIYDNSNILHERFRGVIEIYPKA